MQSYLCFENKHKNLSYETPMLKSSISKEMTNAPTLLGRTKIRLHAGVPM